MSEYHFVARSKCAFNVFCYALLEANQSVGGKFKKASNRSSGTPFFCFRKDIEQVILLRKEFQKKGDNEGMMEWQRKVKKDLEVQRKVIAKTPVTAQFNSTLHVQEAEHLLKYINSVAVSRSDELEALKSERRDRYAVWTACESRH
jgi:hypothetical protein